MNMMDWVGQTLGKYRIESPLDAGGMGQVFRGMHTFLNRPAAIKVMRVNLADNPNFRARFLQEAQSAAALRHPNIVEIYDFGDQDGHLFLVMELMTDGSLRTLLRRRVGGQPWPLSLGLDLARQAAEGLAEAHAQGMVHRDIKPDNLLLNRLKSVGQQNRPEEYQLKISDFGLAKLAAGSGLTITGAPMGTLAYMSPEQCQGGQLDGRSDLYALGVVLYQIATGYLPFQISTFEEALQKHVNVAPLPPHQVRADVPPLIEEIILRCMAKRPEERYATGTELAQALRRALGDERLETVAPISLPPPAPADKTTLQSPVAGATPAPIVSTLPGASPLPRVRVLDQNGQTLQVVEVTGYGLTVGRQNDSNIVLQGQAVSRQHLRVTWDGKQVTVTDQGSSNGTLLGDARLLPQVSQVWMPRQVIRIGSFWLRLEGPSSQAFSSTPDALSQTQLRGGSLSQTQLRETLVQRTSSQLAASLAGSGRIGVIAEPDTLTITPGQSAVTQVTLVNLGSIVDWFTITVEGVAQEWVQGPGQEVQLNPGMEQTVVLNVNVGRTSSSQANDYPVTIRARSREKPEESGTAQAHWTVLPFKEDELRIEPRRVSGRGKANYAITLRNGGNAAAGYSLSGDDDEQKLAYRFGKNEVALEPGKEEKVPLTVETRRYWLGREQRKSFKIHARPAGSSIPFTTPGEFVNKALIPGWLLTMVGIVVTAGVILGALLGPLRASTPPLVKATTTPTVGATGAPTVGTTITPTVGTTITPTVGTTPSPSPTSPPGSNWITVFSINSYVSGITSSGSQYVAVGGGGAIFTSTDGRMWIQRDSGTQIYLGGIIWSGSQYVAVGGDKGVNGLILTSTDGSNWNPAQSGLAHQLNDVTSSGNQYVAVGYGGLILTSTDGSTWMSQNSFTSNNLYSVTFSSSNNQYVAVGDGGVIRTSTDGNTWMSPVSGTSNALHGVTSSLSSNQYVAVGDGGVILTSNDGTTWTRRISQTPNNLFAVSSSLSNNHYVAVGTGVILNSTDGTTWMNLGVDTQRIHHAVTSSPATGQYVVGADDGTILISG